MKLTAISKLVLMTFLMTGTLSSQAAQPQTEIGPLFVHERPILNLTATTFSNLSAPSSSIVEIVKKGQPAKIAARDLAERWQNDFTSIQRCQEYFPFTMAALEVPADNSALAQGLPLEMNFIADHPHTARVYAQCMTFITDIADYYVGLGDSYKTKTRAIWTTFGGLAATRRYRTK